VSYKLTQLDLREVVLVASILENMIISWPQKISTCETGFLRSQIVNPTSRQVPLPQWFWHAASTVSAKQQRNQVRLAVSFVFRATAVLDMQREM